LGDPEAWVLADMCSVPAGKRMNVRETVAPALASVRAGQRLLGLVRGNSSGARSARANPWWVATATGGVTSAGLWLASEAVLHARNAIGNCTARLVGKALKDASRGNRWAPASTESTESGRYDIGVQIRRGDACERWARHVGDGAAKVRRPCFEAGMYLNEARHLVRVLDIQRWGESGSPSTRRAVVHRLLVATDSPTAAAELLRLVPKGEFEVVQASSPRGAEWGGVHEATGGGHGARSTHEVNFIEARNDRHLVKRETVIGSLHADLELLSLSDAFVGTAASWTSRLALLAIVAEQGKVPPFALLDQPLRQIWFA
jgi:hypothetical protein